MHTFKDATQKPLLDTKKNVHYNKFWFHLGVTFYKDFIQGFLFQIFFSKISQYIYKWQLNRYIIWRFFSTKFFLFVYFLFLFLFLFFFWFFFCLDMKRKPIHFNKSKLCNLETKGLPETFQFILAKKCYIWNYVSQCDMLQYVYVLCLSYHTNFK